MLLKAHICTLKAQSSKAQVQSAFAYPKQMLVLLVNFEAQKCLGAKFNFYAEKYMNH
jgi:hypothetical protein